MINQYDRQELQQAELLLGPMGQYLKLGMELAIMLLRALSFSVEMIVRKDLGIRYVSPIKFMLALGWIWLVYVVLWLFVGAGWLSTLFALFLWPLFIFHYWSSNRKFWKKGITWYTNSSGISRFYWIVYWGKQWNIPIINKWDEWFLYRWIDPLYLLVLGLELLMLDTALGIYLILCTCALFAKNQMEFMQARNEFLDTVDATIIAQYRQEAMSGKPKEDTKGYSVVTPPQNVNFDIDLIAPASAPGSNDKPDFSSTLDEMMNPASTPAS